MDDKIKHIIESGVLESYLLGLTDEKQTQEIDELLSENPLLRTELESLEDVIYNMTESIAVEPPKTLLPKIKDAIRTDQSGQSKKSESDKSKTVDLKPTKKTNWFAIAAAMLALFCSVLAFNNYQEAKNANEQLLALQTNLEKEKALREEISQEFEVMSTEFQFIKDANTSKYILNGNEKMKEMKLVAFWNDQKNQSSISVNNLPQLPKGKCLQVWADVEGEMLSIGIIDNASDNVSLKYLANAESLNVTIEPEGGSDHPTVSDLVANVFI
ncbi:MAG: anti-sigma factor [Saprospiraceae bacterium]|nr:anti-sigma factor [Bacteroidia bacterium]NNE13899.1 anti-sigma factor [Saprospiraceae bacterium]